MKLWRPTAPIFISVIPTSSVEMTKKKIRGEETDVSEKLML